MAILKFKRLIEDLENNTTQVLTSVTFPAATATYAGSAAYAGTATVSHFGSSGTAPFYGTSGFAGTGL